MVESEEFKRKIEKVVSQEYKIEFLGKNFEAIVHLLTDKQAESIYTWILKVCQKEIQPIMVSAKKPYKDWQINQLLVFRYPFRYGNTEYRILFVKVKNSIYIEFHLGDHNYYDKVRKDLQLTNKNY